jgi:hypothetical protein
LRTSAPHKPLDTNASFPRQAVAASPSSPSRRRVQRRFPSLRYLPSRSALKAPCAYTGPGR